MEARLIWCDLLFSNSIGVMIVLSLILLYIYYTESRYLKCWIWIYVICTNFLLGTSLYITLNYCSMQNLIMEALTTSLSYESISHRELYKILEEYSQEEHSTYWLYGHLMNYNHSIRRRGLNEKDKDFEEKNPKLE